MLRKAGEHLIQDLNKVSLAIYVNNYQELRVVSLVEGNATRIVAIAAQQVEVKRHASLNVALKLTIVNVCASRELSKLEIVSLAEYKINLQALVLKGGGIEGLRLPVC